jgi:hypothetical protein
VRTLASAEHDRAPVNRQAELAIDRYAITLDPCHRTTDRKQTRDQPPQALQHAHAHQADAPSRKSVRPGQAVRLRAEGLRPPAPRPRQGLHPVRLPRTSSAYPRLRRHVRAEHHRRGRQVHPPGAQLRIDTAELARMYERAYLDDMRALRNDSVDVYPRAGDYIDVVVSQIERLQQAGATPSGRAARCTTGRIVYRLGGSTRTACRGRASARSRVPCRCWAYVLRRGCWTVSMCPPGIGHHAASS